MVRTINADRTTQNSPGRPTVASRRRQFLRAVGATGIAGVLAGCLGDDDDDDDDEDAPDADDTGDGDDTDDEPADSAVFEVSELAPGDETSTRGDVVDVTATIENTGDQTDTQNVELVVDGDGEAAREVTLDGGETEDVSLELDTTTYLGDTEYEVTTDDDAASATLTVEGVFGDEPDPLIQFDEEVVGLVPGENAVSASLNSPYHVSITGTVELAVPDDWGVADESGTEFEIETFGSADVEWVVSVPEDTDEDEYELTVDISYESGPEAAEASLTHPALFTVPADLEEGVELYAPMDQDPPVEQVSGQPLTVYGDPEFGVESYVGQAMRVTENGQAAEVENVPINGEEATITCWFNFEDIDDYARIFQFGTTTGPTDRPGRGAEFQFRPTDGEDPEQLQLQVKQEDNPSSLKVGGDDYEDVPGSDEDSEVPVRRETWYFAAIVLEPDHTRWHLYDLDGEHPDSPKAVDGEWRDTSEPEETNLTLLHGDGNATYGRIEEVKGFDTALTEDELDDIFEDYVDG